MLCSNKGRSSQGRPNYSFWVWTTSRMEVLV